MHRFDQEDLGVDLKDRSLWAKPVDGGQDLADLFHFIRWT